MVGRRYDKTNVRWSDGKEVTRSDGKKVDKNSDIV